MTDEIVKIAIGIPTVNCFNYLRQTWESLVTKHSMKFCLIDNGSVEPEIDNFGAYLASIGHTYISYPENIGVAMAWNNIIQWGLGIKDVKLILILNNDIVLTERTIDSMVQAVIEEEYEGISGVNVGSSPLQLQIYRNKPPRYSGAMNFSCFGLTPRTIKRVGLFDENFKVAYFEDNDYHHRMNLENVKNACDHWAPFSHYGSRTIREGGVNHTAAFQANQRYFKEKWGFLP